MNLDYFLNKDYNFNKYNCGHFVSEVYEHITGENIKAICTAFVNNDLMTYRTYLAKRTKLEKPVSPCVVLMRDKKDVHAGVFIENKIIHLSTHGVRYESLHDFDKSIKMKFYQ